MNKNQKTWDREELGKQSSLCAFERELREERKRDNTKEVG